MVGGRLRDENGSQIVQSVIAIPIILMFALSSLQITYVSIVQSVLSSQIQKAVVAIDATAFDRGDKDAELKRQIANYSDMIDAGALKVSNTIVHRPAPSDLAANVSGGNVTSIEKHVQTAVVEADIHYRIPTMINAFGFADLELERHVSSTQTIDAKVEVR